MEEKNLIFQQYKLYSEQKESFITRSFAINRFYLCLAIILLVLVNIFKGIMFFYRNVIPFTFIKRENKGWYLWITAILLMVLL